MPEYLAPGVYVEEVSYRSKSIEGVSTTTTGFIGPTSYGPIDLEPEVLVSIEEFERLYGGGQQLRFEGGLVMDNHVYHAGRVFWLEGGRRLYVSRVFRPLTDDPYPPADFMTAATATRADDLYVDGHARAAMPITSPPTGDAGSIHLRARFPGAAGNMRVRFTLQLGQNVLGGKAGSPTVGALGHDDIVFIRDQSSPINNPPGAGKFYRAESYFDAPSKKWKWRFIDENDIPLELNDLRPDIDPKVSDQVRVVTLSITVNTVGSNPSSQTWGALALDKRHLNAGAPDSFTDLFTANPPNVAQARSLPIVITLGNDLKSGLDVLQALLDADTVLKTNLVDADSTDVERSVDMLLEGGNDGRRPLSAQFEGQVDPVTDLKSGLKAFEDLEDISIVAAPGSTFRYEDATYQLEAANIINLLIAHANLMRYRIVIADCGNDQSISSVRAMRAKINSKYVAFYYPWVRVVDPITSQPIYLPPSGFVAGIYARNDINRAVYKAPANEVVNLAVGFERLLNKAQQDVLNPEGINCFRFFEGRGYLLWGARLATDDPEWKYVNLRRYFAYLERSIDRGTQWAVFEVNSERLWTNVRYTIQDFLYNEWVSGAFLGDKPDKAYFVRCDRSTMTQNDLDNGRLICLIGVAAVRPAEFVIFRIGQWTGDRK